MQSESPVERRRRMSQHLGPPPYNVEQLASLIDDVPDFPKKGIGMESRGFIFAAPIAYLLGAGFVPVRKLGKLPGEVISTEYDLEYGTNTLELHSDAISAADRVLIVDDLLATGGTVSATIELVERLHGKVVAVAFLVELTALNGRDRLQDYEVVSLIKF